jgi:hypothetical protein
MTSMPVIRMSQVSAGLTNGEAIVLVFWTIVQNTALMYDA